MADDFPPIFLTSVTTFVGLLPLMPDRSLQAQFLIPMAVSLAFGDLLATVVTLYLIPCTFLFGDDLIGEFVRGGPRGCQTVSGEQPRRRGLTLNQC